MIKEIRAAFKNEQVKITSDRKQSYVNIARKSDGLNCEFDLSGSYLTGSYELKGKEKSIDLDLTNSVDMELLVHYVRIILELGAPSQKTPPLEGKYPPLRLIKGGRAA